MHNIDKKAWGEEVDLQKPEEAVAMIALAREARNVVGPSDNGYQCPRAAYMMQYYSILSEQ